jgi:serine protease inhibitor
MKRRLTTARILGVLLVLLTACISPVGPGAGTTPTPDPRAATAAQHVNPALVRANTGFAFKLFGDLAARDAGKNLFISPASVSFALAMTYNGAAGDTQQAMARTLGFDAMSREEVNQAFDLLRLTLANPTPDIRLGIANSLWARKDAAFRPDFLARDRQYYGAELSLLDFSDPSAPGTINDWVKRRTENRIDKVVDKIDPLTLMFLINAIYFKAPWSHPFGPANTHDGTFTLADGSTRQVPLMYGEPYGVGYYRGDGFQAVSLPYGAPMAPTPEATADPNQPPYQQGRVAMYVFLPDRESSLEQFYTQLTPENWERWMGEFHGGQVKVTLPKFRFEYASELKEPLSALGMDIAFDQNRADFSDMVTLPPGMRAYIASALHKTYVGVDEEGTEAAAVTVIQVVPASIQLDQPEIVVDRPFFFAVRDTATGSILFMGAVTDPGE